MSCNGRHDLRPAVGRAKLVDRWLHAALVSSSYLRLGPLLRWIPFYLLPQAMAAIPELQHPSATTLKPRDVVACFRANLWDDASRRMVRYRDARLSPAI